MICYRHRPSITTRSCQPCYSCRYIARKGPLVRVSACSEPARTGGANEDWVAAAPGLIVVIDGTTVRTKTGCKHGAAWYATQLGSALSTLASNRDMSLPTALRAAIQYTADQHRECDLTHPGTPSAAVAALRSSGGDLEYLVLGDITVVLDSEDRLEVVVDDRVRATVRSERDTVDRHLIGSPEKQSALLRMKNAELAVRNQPGGYWVAAADASGVTQALTGKVALNGLRRIAVLSDGAARIVVLYGLVDWAGLLDVLDETGPDDVVRRVRAIEAADPEGRRWPRNKRSDDATIVYAC
jgi:hypothetical protein